jgi:hypothetical protein
VLAFLNAWTAGQGAGDFNDDGDINTLDVLAFLNAWTRLLRNVNIMFGTDRRCGSRLCGSREPCGGQGAL